MVRYIDADKLAEKIKQCAAFRNLKSYYFESNIIKNVLLDLIDNQPTADVAEVKHGEWDVNVGMNFNKERICPICKKRIESNYWEFCSHCGAKMDSQL